MTKKKEVKVLELSVVQTQFLYGLLDQISVRGLEQKGMIFILMQKLADLLEQPEIEPDA